MADSNIVFMPVTEEIEKAEIPRLQMSEMGGTGLRVTSGVVYEELKKELQFPHSVVTYKQMSYDSIIAAALQANEMLMMKPTWGVKAPENATPEQLEKTLFIKQCMSDMEHSWSDFIQEASSMLTYGFSVHEIVLRKRLKSKGSRYNDGLIGWKKLPIRGQDSIDKWIYSEDGRELVGVQQNLNLSSNNGRISSYVGGKEVIIPRKKFLLLRTGKRKENPFGESILRGCYFAWKFRTSIQETEGVGISRDLSGLPVAYIPPQYMSADASPEQKAIYEYYKNLIRNIQMNQQAGLVMPQAYDPETKQPLFKFELMGVEGGKSYKTTEIISRYNNEILTCLMADILILGQGATGSYALGSIKSNLMSMAIEARLKEIANVVNKHLIPMTFEMNGWNDEELPEIYFDDFKDESMEEFSKFVQRVFSVGGIEMDREVLNKIRRSMGVTPYPEDEPIHYELMNEKTSKAGNELGNPLEGSRRTDNGQNDNDGNLENTA